MPVRIKSILDLTNWERTSPSQLKTFKDCPKKWWFDKISRHKERTTTPAQARGKRVHAVLEEWLKDCVLHGKWLMSPGEWESFLDYCTLPPEIQPFEISLARAARGWVSQTVDLETAKAEGEFMFKTPLGHKILGIMDIICSQGVTDYKTTSSWQWVPTEEELREDPQCIAYCAAYFQKYPNALTCRYQHIYMNTKTGGVLAPVSFDVTRAQSDQAMADLDWSIQCQADYSKILNSTEVPGAPGAACDKYRGCEFQSVCGSYRKNNLGGDMGLFAKYKQKKHQEGTEKAKEVQNDYNDDVQTDLDATLKEAGFSEEQIEGMSVAERARLASKAKYGQLTEADLKACKVNPPDGMPHDEAAPKPKAMYSGATFPGTSIGVMKCKGKDIIDYFQDYWKMDPKDVKKLFKEYRAEMGWTAAQLKEELAKNFTQVDTPITNWISKITDQDEVDSISGKTREQLREEAAPTPKKKVGYSLHKVNTKEEPPPPATKKDPIIRQKADEIRQQVSQSSTLAPQLLLVDCILLGAPIVTLQAWAKSAFDKVQAQMGDELWTADQYGSGAKDVAKLIYEYLEKGGKGMDFDLDPLPPVLYVSTTLNPAAKYIIGALADHYPQVIKGV